MFSKKTDSKDPILSNELEQFTNRRKIIELDLEKRILVLESVVDEMKKNNASSSEIKDLKNALSKLLELKDKLRDMEDLDLITKLETIQTQDDVHIISDELEALKSKMDMLTGAVKIVTTKLNTKSLVGDAKSQMSDFHKTILSLKSEVDYIRKEMVGINPEKQIQKIADIERKYSAIDSGFKNFISTVRSDLDQKEKELKSMLLNQVNNGGLRNKNFQVDENLSLTKLSPDPVSRDSVKYVPVLKENVLKLYKAYRTVELRLGDIEKGIANITSRNMQGVLPESCDLDGAIKNMVDNELKEVVDNIKTLNVDIKSHLDDEIKRQSAFIALIKKESDEKIRTIEQEINEPSRNKGSYNTCNYEEFAEFKARVLSEVDDLRKELTSFEQGVSIGEVENIIDNKIIPHASAQDKIAKSISLVNRKIEQKHLELSKNAHEKINGSVKPVVERILQVEGDVEQLRDMREDIVGDVKTLLDAFNRERKKDGLNLQDENKFREFENKLIQMQSEINTLASNGNDPGNVNEMEMKIQGILDENDILKQELEKVKNLYFEMLRQQQGMPVVIE